MQFRFAPWLIVLMSAGCATGPQEPPSPANGHETTAMIPGDAHVTPTAPRKGLLRLRSGDRLRFDEAWSRIKLISINEVGGLATIALQRKGLPDETVSLALKQPVRIPGETFPFRLIKIAENCAVIRGIGPWGNDGDYTESSLPNAKGYHEISGTNITSCGPSSLSLSPGESWAMDGLSGDLVIVSVDEKLGRVDCRFVYDGGRAPRDFGLRLGYKFESNGLTLGLHSISPDGTATIERF